MPDTTTPTRPARTPGPWSEPVPFAGSRFEIQAGNRQLAIFATLEDARMASRLPAIVEYAERLANLVEAYLRDGDESIAPSMQGTTEEQVAEAVYALRAAIDGSVS